MLNSTGPSPNPHQGPAPTGQQSPSGDPRAGGPAPHPALSKVSHTNLAFCETANMDRGQRHHLVGCETHALHGAESTVHLNAVQIQSLKAK